MVLVAWMTCTQCDDVEVDKATHVSHIKYIQSDLFTGILVSETEVLVPGLQPLPFSKWQHLVNCTANSKPTFKKPVHFTVNQNLTLQNCHKHFQTCFASSTLLKIALHHVFTAV